MKTSILILLFAALCSIRGLAQDVVDGPGKDLIIRDCTNCHGTELITAKHYTKAEWKSVVGVMISYGANVPDSDIEVITTFLAKNYGKSNVAIRTGAKDQ